MHPEPVEGLKLKCHSPCKVQRNTGFMTELRQQVYVLQKFIPYSAMLHTGYDTVACVSHLMRVWVLRYDTA